MMCYPKLCGQPLDVSGIQSYVKKIRPTYNRLFFYESRKCEPKSIYKNNYQFKVKVVNYLKK